MATNCLRCSRPIPDWHDAAGPDDCRGGESCREREEDRNRLAWRVVEAARLWARDGVRWASNNWRRPVCIACGEPATGQHTKDCANERLAAALRALDGEEG